MAKTTKKPLKITETVLRDAHQSLIATRMTTEQMLPIIDKMDKAGFHALLCPQAAGFGKVEVFCCLVGGHVVGLHIEAAGGESGKELLIEAQLLLMGEVVEGLHRDRPVKLGFPKGQGEIIALEEGELRFTGGKFFRQRGQHGRGEVNTGDTGSGVLDENLADFQAGAAA